MSDPHTVFSVERSTMLQAGLPRQFGVFGEKRAYVRVVD
jgi:hypothetical protein